jgi:spore coat polysaccharide biosynthesis protein SpsF
MNLDLLIIVQARLSSTRLPGKVLLDICGQPMLARMLERLERIQTPAKIIVATTTESADDAIVALCSQLEIDVFRGHPSDLLDRHYQAAKYYGATAVAKIPSDCPLIDPTIADSVFDYFVSDDFDYVSNLHPASYPDGNDIEVMSMEVLTTAWREAGKPLEREHTTPFIWENPKRFRLGNVYWEGAILYGNCSMTHRFTVDYLEDYGFVRRVFEELYPEKPDFNLADIMALLESKPHLKDLNACHLGVNWYRHHLHELKTVDARHTRVA